MPSYYELLGVPPDADGERIREAYVEAVLGAPAVEAGPAPRDRRLDEAFAVLGDPERRRRYDELRASEGTGNAELLALLSVVADLGSIPTAEEVLGRRDAGGPSAEAAASSAPAPSSGTPAEAAASSAPAPSSGTPAEPSDQDAPAATADRTWREDAADTGTPEPASPAEAPDAPAPPPETPDAHIAAPPASPAERPDAPPPESPPAPAAAPSSAGSPGPPTAPPRQMPEAAEPASYRPDDAGTPPSPSRPPVVEPASATPPLDAVPRSRRPLVLALVAAAAVGAVVGVVFAVSTADGARLEAGGCVALTETEATAVACDDPAADARITQIVDDAADCPPSPLGTLDLDGRRGCLAPLEGAEP
jgi:hypothetical protein